MERLIDDCIIMDYGSILIQQPIETLMKGLRKYTCTVPEGYQPQLPVTCYHPAVIRQTLETYSFLPPSDVEGLLKENQVPFTGLQHENVSMEYPVIPIIKRVASNQYQRVFIHSL